MSAGEPEPEGPQITLQKGTDEVLSPDHAGFLVSSKIGARKTATVPKHFLRVVRHLPEIEATHFDDFDLARQRLECLAGKLRRRTPQDQKCRQITGAVSQHTQHRKDAGLTLRLVNHHQAPQALQRSHGILHEPSNDRVLDVKIQWVIGWKQLPRQGGLATLAGAENSHHGASGQRLFHIG